MFDFKFDWDNSMNVGIDLIDEQHRELFRIAREIEQLVITKCIDVEFQKLLDIVCELREYVSYHFYHEEQIMTQYQYSNFASHKKLHDNFTDSIIDINLKKLKQNPYKELVFLKDLLQNWVFSHILIEDKKMADEINGRMK